MPQSSAQTVHPAQSAPKRSLPPWYYRLVALTIKEDREVEPYDFDEDLSDLEEPNENAEKDNDSMHGSCECDNEDSDCDCESLGHDTDDSLTQRSYDGSDADYYYELKYDREERKRERRDIRNSERKAKEAQRDFEGQKENEVQEAYEHLQQAFRQGDVPPILDLHAGKLFHLYSVDHMDHCYNPDLYPSKYVEFYTLDDSGAPADDEHPPGDEATQIHGHVYFNVDCGCDFAPFPPPKHACLEEHLLKSFHGEFELEFRFISNDYIIMTVPRELVFIDSSPIPSAPEIFKFMGIRYDREKEKQRRDTKRKRSPSPRESWFEMNHPMGSWNLGGW
ncbi:hypothetical protein EDB81DRAFT_799641 [Dactylonectria macrodidyma]|uniref:Uncharacterized protein n=1 Tax=Dactylonectria macrodidyma TaxID=307937 RepID=A0A9P9EG02_9HYPO|nr:hypothetical protein EDB81DRAFT_799641 [Dactylonectria macrodidyma]